MRNKYELTDEELAELKALRDDYTDEERGLDAWGFWFKVCKTRGLDSATAIAGHVRGQFSALPLGHNRHWCYPSPLKCAKAPELFEPMVVVKING